MAAKRNPIILVEIDLWDGSNTQTLRLSNFGTVTRAFPASSGAGVTPSAARSAPIDYDAATRAVVERTR